MTKPAFLVEGFMEQKIVQRLCPGAPVRRIGCNGDAVDMTVIAKFLRPQIKLLRHHSPIIIIFDREKRTKTSASLKTELIDLLKSSDLKIAIGIPDKTIESWILDDWETIRKHHPQFTEYTRPKSPAGKGAIKNLIPVGEFYTETTMGPRLFCLINPRNVYLRSETFRSLVDEIHGVCSWLSSARC